MRGVFTSETRIICMRGGRFTVTRRALNGLGRCRLTARWWRSLVVLGMARTIGRSGALILRILRSRGRIWRRIRPLVYRMLSLRYFRIRYSFSSLFILSMRQWNMLDSHSATIVRIIVFGRRMMRSGHRFRISSIVGRGTSRHITTVCASHIISRRHFSKGRPLLISPRREVIP
jgi:hypothetical protein